MTTSRMVINPNAIEQMLRGPQSTAQKKHQARKVADAWRANIKDVTGATDRSIDVEQHGREVDVVADRARNPESAWSYLEWGTSKMRAQSPGRRAVRRS